MPDQRRPPVVSRDESGSLVGDHDTAETLADAGFIVAAINHPGDTVSNMSRSEDLSVSVERPADIRRLIHFLVGASPAASNSDAEHIGFFGFSMGGYTGSSSSVPILPEIVGGP